MSFGSSAIRGRWLNRILPPAFLSRAAAKLIDFVIIVAFVGGLAAFLWMLVPPAVAWFLPPLCIMGCLLGLLGYTILAEHHAGQTIGKRLMGIHVVRESGARISLGQSVIRHAVLAGICVVRVRL